MALWLGGDELFPRRKVDFFWGGTFVLPGRENDFFDPESWELAP
jgi:hypothetical protein